MPKNNLHDSFIICSCLFFLLNSLSASAGPALWRHISLGQPVIEKGVHLLNWQDGQWRITQLGGQSCIETVRNGLANSAYLYFAVDDDYVFSDAFDVFVTVEYFDRGSGQFHLQYDGNAGPYTDGGSKPLSSSNSWSKHTYVLPSPSLTNRQNGGADFRLAILDTTIAPLAVKNVWVWRAPGSNIAPKLQDFTGETFSATDDLVFIYYFYWYDIYSGAHIWDNAEQTDDALQDHPASMEDFSWKSVAWHKQELLDIMAAGIDVILPIYWGSAREMEGWSVEGLVKLLQAEEELIAEGKNPPKIGMFFDTTTLFYGEYILKSGDGQTDLSTTLGKAYFFKHLRDFFSLIPPALWARIDGRPVVWLYAAAFAKNASQSLVNYVNDRFAASFGGLQPYIVREISWNLNTQKDYAWGAALNGAQLFGAASVGPGYNDSAVPGRTTPIRERENGDFYRRNWSTVLGSGRNLVVVETWNELHEGTDICNSREYGRQYIDLTAEYSQTFKQSTKWSSFQPQGWIQTLHPNCSVKVQDKTFGLKPATVQCSYTDDNGASWHAWPATCTGANGTTESQTVSAANIPFAGSARPLSTRNHVRFAIVNARGDSAVSPSFPVYNGTAPDFAAEIRLGSDPKGNGIRQRYHRNDDGWSADTSLLGVPCSYNLVKNPSPYPGRYLYFDVEDSLIFAGTSPEIWLTVDYYDTSATGAIELQYDSPGSTLSNWYKSGGSVAVANTRKWKSKTFHLNDAYFGNRENGSSDFRFYTSGVMFLSRVFVSNRETSGVQESRRSREKEPILFGLEQNYPNPFNQTTTIAYHLFKDANINLTVYDIGGRRVCTLINERQAAGRHQFQWDGQSDFGPIASGLYFLRLATEKEQSVRRLLFLR